MRRRIPCLPLSLLLMFGAAAACGDDDGRTPIAVTTREATPVAPEAATGAVVTLAAVGDVMMARTVGEAMAVFGAASPFAALAPELRSADLTFANLEMALTERGEPQPKDFVFRAPPPYADGLVAAGIDIVSLANNHILDYGPEGLADTLAALAARGVATTGAGPGLAAASTPSTIEVSGLRIAVLAFATFRDDGVSGFPARTFEATAGRPGIAWAERGAVVAGVGQAAATHDIVIVSMHWGDEYRDAVSDEQRALGRAAIEAGATLVLGHGPHVTQGWERYGSGLIVYSLGNFVFDLDATDYAFDGLPSTHSLIFRAELDAGGVRSAGYVPVMIDEASGYPRTPTAAEEVAVRARLARLAPAIDGAIAALGPATATPDSAGARP